MNREEVPIGTILSFATDKIPNGFLECDGQEIKTNDYPELFRTIGTIYGGTGVETFKVPDMRGQFLRGWSHGSNKDPDAAFRIGGDTVGSKQSYATN